ncbi:SPOR domain-containing protein [Sphingopyxis yananensis]|uniref:SPOR domain-containing protein n=1 Tax=Sphingopyxis yananensis TaxID=2886687 RepID=UPI001D0FB92C|nr:SPOR domain-containing protein [Sphingopyxis yananensis]MCC2603266.1 SPOR domain-containing protein [Sphingopyxis yananensis]
MDQRAFLGRAWPAALLMMGAVAGVSATPAAAFQASQTDAATKAAMEKRAAARTLLTSALSRIAANGNNAAALLDAGKASMALDDYRAALGFLLRAEQNSPRDGAVKAALGTAMVHQENPQRALDYFGEAQLLRTPERLFVADRALAHDLLGQVDAAQRDYALALTQVRDDEIVRRYALSLGMGGQPDRAVELLTPLLEQQDRSAWRTRAMVLAMNGRQAEAKKIIDATLPPALAQNIWPYVEQMDRLTPAQQAAAAHFGRFPSGPLGPKRAPVQMAAATPVAAPATKGSAAARPGRSGTRAATNSASNTVAAQTAQRAAQQTAAQQTAAQQAAAQAHSQPAPAATNGPIFTSTSTVLPSASGATAAVAAPVAATPTVAPPASSTRSVSLPDPVRVAGNNVSGDRGPSSTVRDMTAAAATADAARSRVQNVVQAQTSPAATRQAAVSGPVDSEATRAVVTAPPPASAALRPPPPPASVPSQDAPLAAMASLSDIVGSLEIPAEEMARSQNALSADVLARVREEGRRAEMEAAAKAREEAARARAEAAAKARADAAAKAKADAEAKAKAEAEAKAREEAAKKRANPSRIWVQIGSGSNVGALGFTYDRYAKKHGDLFKGVKGGHSEWGRTRRLLAGPFNNRAAAQRFLDSFKAAEGDGFVFTSASGEEVEWVQ